VHKSLLGKKFLYVAPRFFGYENEIELELIRRGADVDFILDRPFDTPLMKGLTKLFPKFITRFADRYYRRELLRLGNKTYDYVFVINGQTLSGKSLEHWRKCFDSAEFVIYMWDSFGNRKNSIANLKYFDHCFSFDKSDAHRYKIRFRPLFFSEGFEVREKISHVYDISFVGTAHTDRYSVISAVKEIIESNNSYWYLFLQAKWVFWLYKLINPHFKYANLSEFKFDSITKSQVQDVFFKSKVVLDVEHPGQTGLTMRTLEALGAKKKIITTNSAVMDYDFFNADNICIIDRASPVVPSSFLTSPYVEVNSEIYQQYRLSGWMDEVLSDIKL
tara:strand:+ start:1370 stop:2365 length:996 start_codon:yes stop_codon:yes gene_type:complete